MGALQTLVPDKSLVVLVVEDDLHAFSLIDRIFREGNHRLYRLAHAVSLESCISLASKEPPDAILLDLNLPDSRGLDTVRRVHKHLPDIPIVITTGDNERDVAIEALRLGAQEFIPKIHLNPTSIWRVVLHSIERKGLGLELRKAHRNLKETQRQLIEVEKMKTIGRISAGVAHEVKNPLATLRMGLEYLDRNADEPNDSMKLVLKEMTEAVKRADGIVQGLLDFSAPMTLTMEWTDLNQLVEEALRLSRHEFRKHEIEARVSYASDTPMLMLDRDKIMQVLLNLFLNATHAMKDGGVLTATTECAAFDADEFDTDGSRADDVEPRSLIQIRITDSGDGIPEALLSKIFDPFFTTKSTGVGTGMGLAVAKSIIDLHGGGLEISNAENGGAEAVLTFIE